MYSVNIISKGIIPTLIVSSLLLFTGCGSGDTTYPTTEGTDKDGYLIDSAVSGVTYTTNSGTTGTTDLDGKFTYNSNDNSISLKVGDLIIKNNFLLSDLDPDGKLLITDLVGVDRSNTTDENVIKILRVLQSLDDDGNASNGINIDTTTRDLLVTTTTISDSTIAELNTMVVNANKTLKTEDRARQHFEQTLNDSFSSTTDTVAPIFASDANITVEENQNIALSIVTIDTNDVNYSILNDDNGSFDINSATGLITFKANPNYENPTDTNTDNNYTFMVFATDSNGLESNQTIIVTIANIDDVVPTLTNSTGTIAENSSNGTSVGSVGISDIGDSAISSIVLSGTGNSNFAVATNGAITVSESASLDYETLVEYNLTAIATNTTGASSSIDVDIAVTNIAEIPTIQAFTGSIDENATIGTVVGNITIDNHGDSPISSFTLNDTTNFEINTTGYIKSVTALNHEVVGSYNLTAFATNTEGNSTSVNVAINIVDINDAPDINTTFISFDMLEDNGTINYELNVSDEDGDDLNITVESNNTSILTVTQNWTNNLNQAAYNGVTLDFNLTTVLDAFGSVKITITVNDSDKNSSTFFDINVTDVVDYIDHNGLQYIAVISSNTSKVWLDRNLGATQVCDALDDTDCYGDYYQWGRGTDGHEKSNSAITDVLSDSTTVGHGNFIKADNDWTNVDENRSTRSENWNPCPSGYRIPTIDELLAENIDSSSDAYNKLKLPSAGSRYRQNGYMSGQGTSGYLWSSSVSVDGS